MSSGVDFLGWIIFSDHKVLRTVVKKRMLKRIKEHPTEYTLQAYLGLLRHGNSYRLREEVLFNFNNTFDL
jgi:hypothetical protein